MDCHFWERCRSWERCHSQNDVEGTMSFGELQLSFQQSMPMCSGFLLKLIASHFEEDASGYTKECRELDELRVAVCNAPMDYTACGTLKRYYCQLCFLLNRFPFLVSDHVPGLSFTWEDLYEANSYTHSVVDFEKAAIMYNIGTIHSCLGSSDNRSTPEGMKVSCTHLQCAAWAFQQVRDNFSSSFCSDWSYAILSFQEQIMLAQSQECILEKSMADNRKSSITAKVAVQCAEFYKKALGHLEGSKASNAFGSSQTKKWKKHIEMKLAFTRCVSYYYLTLQAEEQSNYGERLTYAQAAAEYLGDCVRLSQGMGEEVKTAIQFINDVVTGKYTAAKKDNDFVYHEKVIPLDSLPEVKGAVLVKGIGFEVSDKAVSGPDIFSKLVPMEAHEASSLYSEEKATLLRDVGGNLEEHDTSLAQYLASIQIDPDKLLPEFDTIPDSLVEKCAAISVRPETIKELTGAMDDLAKLSTSTLADIDKTGRILETETEQEQEFQDKYGKRRVPETLESIAAELEKGKQAFTKATQSNTDLHKAMDLHIQNLNLLASPLEKIKAELPNPQSVLADEEVAVVTRIKLLFEKINEMRKVRTDLYNKLREQVMADDITKKIVTRSSDDTKELFAAQLRKHTPLVDQLDVYLLAQPKILGALTKANVDFVPIRQKIDMALFQREAKIKSLVHSYDAYHDLLDKQRKGMDFYQKLKHNVEKLLEKASELHSVQEKEREVVAEKLKPKGPPPARPTASKPGAAPQPKPVSGSKPKSGGGPPRLKDYLPFMKVGSNASSAIDSVAAGVDLDDDFDDLDDVELPDVLVSSAPKLKDFFSFNSKGGNMRSTNPHGGVAALPADLSGLPAEALKYLPQNMGAGLPTSLPQMAGAVNYTTQSGPMYVPPSHPSVPMNRPAAPPSVQPPPGQVQMPGTLNQPQMQTPRSEIPAQRPMGGLAMQPPRLPSVSPMQGPPARHPNQFPPCGIQRFPPSSSNQNPGLYALNSVAGVSTSMISQPPFNNHAYSNASMAPSHLTPHSISSSQAPVSHMPQVSQMLPMSSATWGPSSQLPPTSHMAALPQTTSTAQMPNMSNSQITSVPQHSYVPTRPNSTPTSAYTSLTSAHPQHPQQQHPRHIQPQQHVQQPHPQQQHHPQHPLQHSQQHPQQHPQQQPPQLQHPRHIQPQQHLQPQPQQYPQQQHHPQQQQKPPQLQHPQQHFQQQHMQPHQQLPQPQNSSQPQFPQQQKQSFTQMQNPHNIVQQPQHQYSHPPQETQRSQHIQQQNFPNQSEQQHPQQQQPQSTQNQIAQQLYPQQQQPAKLRAPIPNQQQQYPQQHQHLQNHRPLQNQQFPQQQQHFQQPSQQQQSPGQRQIHPQQWQLQNPSPRMQTSAPYSSQQGVPPHANSSQVSAPSSRIANPSSSNPVDLLSDSAPGGLDVPPLQPLNSLTPQSSGRASPASSVRSDCSDRQQLPQNQQQLPPPQHQQLPHQQQKLPQQKLPQQQLPQQQLPQQQLPQQQLPQHQQLPPKHQQSSQQVQQQQVSQQQQLPQQTRNQLHVLNHQPSQQLPHHMIQQPHHPQPSQVRSHHPTEPQYSVQQLPASQAMNAQQQSISYTSQPSTVFSSPSTNEGMRSWPQNQSGVGGQGSQQPIPVLAVSPLRKSHVDELAGVDIIPTNTQLNSSGDLKIDWSKATDTAQPTVKTEGSPWSLPKTSSKSRPSEGDKSQPLVRQMSRDTREPYSDESSLEQFVSAVERYVKQLDTLTKPSLKGPTPLDKEWQDMSEEQESESKRNSTAAGLSESTRNRFQDIIPYDKYRVMLTGQKNDYINASYIEGLSENSPRFIAAQGPLNQTELDFWSMIIQQNVEYIVMLSRWTEQEHSESARYWPRDRNDRLSFGNLLITLQLTNNHKYWIERRMNMTNLVTKETYTCTQLQFTAWPATGLPDRMALLMLVNEVSSLHKKQRSPNHPIIVHCGNGISKTGVFCTLYNGVMAVNSGQGIISVSRVVGLLRQRRRGMVSTQDEYLYCHEALLYYAQDILVKRGILTSQASFANPLSNLAGKSHGRTPSNDFIMSDTSLALLGHLSSLTVSNDSTASASAPTDKQPPAQQNQPELIAKEPMPVKSNPVVEVKSRDARENPNIGSDNLALFSMSAERIKTTDGRVNTGGLFDISNPETFSIGEGTAAQTNSQNPNADQGLLDISNPQTFDIGQGRQRITKADFFNPSGGIKSSAEKADDPFCTLDPMWTLTGK